MPEAKPDLPSDEQIAETLNNKSDILERLAAGPSMVVTEREPHVEIKVNGQAVYDSHIEGHLPLLEVVGRIAGALAVDVTEADYAFEDGTLPEAAQAAVRIAAAKGVRCWALDRAPYADEPSDLPDISG